MRPDPPLRLRRADVELQALDAREGLEVPQVPAAVAVEHEEAPLGEPMGEEERRPALARAEVGHAETPPPRRDAEGRLAQPHLARLSELSADSPWLRVEGMQVVVAATRWVGQPLRGLLLALGFLAGGLGLLSSLWLLMGLGNVVPYLLPPLSLLLAGGALGQIPIGRISDLTDRRYVMVACGAAGVFSAFAMFFMTPLTPNLLYITAFIVGSMLYPIYALNVAHANDRADPSEYVTISSSLMVLYGLGTVAGPLIGGGAMELAGPRGLMLYLAVGFAIYGAYAGWRVWRGNPTVHPDDRADFHAIAVPMRGTDPAGSIAVDYEEEYDPSSFDENARTG